MSFDELDKMFEEELFDEVKKTPEDRCEVLIVDDDEQVLQALDMVLADEYETTLCRTGNEAIKAVSSKTHAVILDVKMRDLDGFDTFIELKKKSPNLPIIFHSAYQDVKNPYDVINDFRPYGYLKKGGSEVELLETLANATQAYAHELAIECLIPQVEQDNKELELIAKTTAEELETLAGKVRAPFEPEDRE